MHALAAIKRKNNDFNFFMVALHHPPTITCNSPMMYIIQADIISMTSFFQFSRVSATDNSHPVLPAYKLVLGLLPAILFSSVVSG